MLGHFHSDSLGEIYSFSQKKKVNCHLLLSDVKQENNMVPFIEFQKIMIVPQKLKPCWSAVENDFYDQLFPVLSTLYLVLLLIHLGNICVIFKINIHINAFEAGSHCVPFTGLA